MLMPAASASPFWQPIQSQLGRDLNVVQQIQLWLLNHLSAMVMAALYFCFFLILWFTLSRFFRVFFKQVQLNEMAAHFVQEILKYVLFLCWRAFCFGRAGCEHHVAPGLFGAALLRLVIWSKLTGVYGKVQNLTLRSTRIVTVDGKMVAFPNTSIVNGKVVSYTNFPNLRLDVDVTIGVNEPIGRARSLLLEAMGQTGKIYGQSRPLRGAQKSQ